MPDAATHAKRALRADVRAARQARTETARDADAEMLHVRLDALVDRFDARAISCFLSTPVEPGTREFVRDAAARGIRVLLPVIRDDGRLDWTVSAPDAELSLGPLGVPEPVGEPEGTDAVGDVDLMIIPAAAVDRTGMRLGWGRGYFDKTLAALTPRPPVFAVVFDDEFVDDVPHSAHDQRVDGVVTPDRTVTFTDLSR